MPRRSPSAVARAFAASAVAVIAALASAVADAWALRIAMPSPVIVIRVASGRSIVQPAEKVLQSISSLASRVMRSTNCARRSGGIVTPALASWRAIAWSILLLLVSRLVTMVFWVSRTTSVAFCTPSGLARA